MATNKQSKKICIIKIKRTVLTGLLFAIALILSYVENALPPLIVTVPGIKIGLSNIVVMYALFFLGKKEAYIIAFLKSAFVLIIRSPVSAFLSLCGGVLSITVMLMLMLIFKKKISYLIISIMGAVFHNIGQLLAVCIIYTNIYILAYLPVLLTAGVVAGSLTTILLKLALPAFNRLGIK